MTTAQPTTLAMRIFHPNVIKVISIALAIVFGIMYVAQMNESSMRSYTIRDLEASERNLVRENDTLQSEIDRLRSLASIRERQTFLGMVKPDNIQYVRVSSNTIALK